MGNKNINNEGILPAAPTLKCARLLVSVCNLG
jgi:hypothetical protein